MGFHSDWVVYVWDSVCLRVIFFLSLFFFLRKEVDIVLCSEREGENKPTKETRTKKENGERSRYHPHGGWFFVELGNRNLFFGGKR